MSSPWHKEVCALVCVLTPAEACVCDRVLAWGKVSQIFARLIISMVSVSAAVRDTKEAACLPVPKAFSTSSFASTSLSLFSQLRSLVWSQICNGNHKHVTSGMLPGGKWEV